MKKIAKIILTASLCFFVASPALAETSLLFSSLEVEAQKGEIFKLSITLDPKNEKNYTTKVELNFPANLLELESFNLGSGWIPVSEPGYDVVDNSLGRLIKTGAFPSGFEATKVFGTATFKAKNNGQGNITVGSGSFSLGATNNDLFSKAFPSATVYIGEQAAEAEVKEVVVEEAGAKEEVLEEVTTEEIFNNIEDIVENSELLGFRGRTNIKDARVEIFLDYRLTETVKVDTEGNWAWLLPELRVGEHIVAIKAVSPSDETRFVMETKNITETKIPTQLFDINLEIDDATVSSVRDLAARVVFVSFGREPTPVDLSFSILNDEGREVYFDLGREVDIVVETEGVFNQSFKDAPELPAGKYILILDTLYNSNVTDEFRAGFEIVPEQKSTFVYWLLAFVLAAGVLGFGLWRRRVRKLEK